jgi:hypothetical protein
MAVNNRMCEAASHVLRKHCVHVAPAGPWRWSAALQNGSLLQLDAWLGEGFLHLATAPLPRGAHGLERALRANRFLPGGVRLALDAASRNLHLRCDLPAAEEGQLSRAMEHAVDGFHSGLVQMNAADSHPAAAPPVHEDSFPAGLRDVLHEISWPCTQRSASDFSVELDADAAPPAILAARGGRIEAAVELVRSNVTARAVGLAMAVFMLTANSALSFCRACSEPGQDQEIYQLRSFLSASSTAEEIEDALAALSVAFRACAREANFLLIESAAQAYLSARQINPQQQLVCNQEE